MFRENEEKQTIAIVQSKKENNIEKTKTKNDKKRRNNKKAYQVPHRKLEWTLLRKTCLDFVIKVILLHDLPGDAVGHNDLVTNKLNVVIEVLNCNEGKRQRHLP